MVAYSCLRCDYETTKKSSMVNHLNRKQICKNLKGIEYLTDELKQLILGRDEKKITKYVTNNTTNIHNDNSTNTTNIDNSTIINNTYNLIVNDLDKIDLSYVKPEYLIPIFKSRQEREAKIYLLCYFDPNHPENHCIYNGSHSRKQIKIQENGTLVIKDKTNAIINSFANARDKLCSLDSLSDFHSKIDSHLELPDDQEELDEFIEKFNALTYNKRNIPKNTYKLIKKA